MSKIVWDGTGERYFEAGVDHGVLYPMTAEGGTYGNGVAWNGLTNVTDSPEGAEPTELWADNIKYGTLRSAETYGGTIEAYTYPPEFEPCNGSVEVASGAYIGQQERVPFGFCYRTMIGSDTDSSADGAYKLHLVYGATVNPSEQSHDTINDSPDASSFSWEFDTNPVPVTGHKPTATMVIDSRTANPTNLATLEAKLYGGSTTEPTLPLPDEVIAILSTTDEE